MLAERLRDINPGIGLTVVDKYIKDEETYILLDAARYDYVVDAIDTLSPKLALIAASLERGLPLVSSMGAGSQNRPHQTRNRRHLENPPLPAGPHAAQAAPQDRHPPGGSGPYSLPSRCAKGP